jgi:hypothetical protein
MRSLGKTKEMGVISLDNETARGALVDVISYKLLPMEEKMTVRIFVLRPFNVSHVYDMTDPTTQLSLHEMISLSNANGKL